MSNAIWKISRTRLLVKAALGLFAIGLAITSGTVYYISNPANEQLPVPPPLKIQNTPLSSTYLSNAKYATDYQALKENFEEQIYRSYCGVASSVTVLKALNIEVSQREYFNKSVSQVRSSMRTFFTGMPLNDLSGLLEAHGAEVVTYYGSQVTLNEFRQIIMKNLSNPNDFALVNYARGALGQKPGGHISPLAAYDENLDKVLVMDVASFKYPPVWIPVNLLFKSISTIDSETGLSRGLVAVRIPGKM